MQVFFAGPVDLFNCSPDPFSGSCMTALGLMVGFFVLVLLIGYGLVFLVTALILKRLGKGKHATLRNFWLIFLIILAVLVAAWCVRTLYANYQANSVQESQTQVCRGVTTIETTSTGTKIYKSDTSHCFDKVSPQ